MKQDFLARIFAQKEKYRGLTQDEAKIRLKTYGPNSGLKTRHKGWLKRALDIASEPMMLLILATAIVYYFLGDSLEAAIFIFTIVPIGLMEYFQEKRTDDTVAELDKMMVEKTKVWRDGKLMDTDVKDVVPGDLIYLTAGDKIPADGFVFSGPGLSVDESIMTGESAPVGKNAIDGSLEKITESSGLRKGTLVAQGEAEFFVEATGPDTEYGRLGSLLEKITKESTPLQKKISRLVRVVAVGALITALLVIIFLSIKVGWREGLLGGLTVAMALIPEEFPVVFSVFLIMGVWHMAKKNALVRQMAMVETLGSATVICTDKTGTLTEGRMSLKRFYFENEWLIINGKPIDDEKINKVCRYALLAFERNAADPMEVEIQSFVEKKLNIKIADFFEQYEILDDSPFSAETKMVHHLWREKANGVVAQYSVGAPEAIMNICRMTENEKSKAEEAYATMAGKGYRVVALAFNDKLKNEKIQAEEMAFIGLTVMSDPPRKGVREAVEMCQEAGIRIMMITGDNKLVAANIAEQVGIKTSGQEILSGEDLEKLSPAVLAKVVATHNIFSRVRPEHKFNIVEALKNNGEIVAMTGDGVNDAPALKKADIGIAMGKKGTEVARAAAGIILMDDEFPTIAEAVREGRRIYHNMRQAFVFLISFHMPIIGLAVVPLFFGQSLVFLPIHIIFLELICDPASVLGFERERAPRGIMKVPPRPADEPIINMALGTQAVIQGIGIFLTSFGFFYYYAVHLGNAEMGRTMAFLSLVFSQILMIFFTREWAQIKSNYLLTGISLGTIVALNLIMIVPFLRKLFHLTIVDFMNFLILFTVSFCAIAFVSLLVVKRKKYV